MALVPVLEAGPVVPAPVPVSVLTHVGWAIVWQGGVRDYLFEFACAFAHLVIVQSVRMSRLGIGSGF